MQKKTSLVVREKENFFGMQKIRKIFFIILIISIAGLLFSGYLSVSELFSNSCPLGGCIFVLGLPSCVYGLVMYLAIFILALIGINSKKQSHD
ncbi:MAG: hypothetical protein NTX24_02155 [Candidatus Pacearchaeota archaeon]|nr:hypothetical protein [Candidatus Pacearchaeota archaeon]